jgi:hypothetical protein
MTDHDHGPPDEKARYASRGNRADPNSFPTTTDAKSIAASRPPLLQAMHADLGLVVDDSAAGADL